jgi:hypothetical protein
MSDEAEIDSDDSPICACGISMLMRFTYAHEVLLCQGQGITREYRGKTTIRRRCRRFRATEKDWISDEAERLTKLSKNLKQKNERPGGI